MKHTLTFLLFAALGQAATIIGPSIIAVTSAIVTVPEGLGGTLTPGQHYGDRKVDAIDQEYLFSITGGTGDALLWLTGEVSGSFFTHHEARGLITSVAAITEPFQLFSVQLPQGQGSGPAFCGTTIAEAGSPCMLQFTFGTPFKLRFRAASASAFNYTHRAFLEPVPAIINSRTAVYIRGVIQNQQLVDSAVIAVAASPEPGGAGLALTGLPVFALLAWMRVRR